MSLLLLELKYPTIKGFIRSCRDNNELDKLFDFLLAIETEDFPSVH